MKRRDPRLVHPRAPSRGPKDSGSKRSLGERFEPHLPLDRRIAELAAAQHGVIALWQLVRLGLSAPGVRHRVSAGRLHRVHAGVYAVGHPRLTLDGHHMAAVLACGRDAALSHRSAAHRLGLRRTGRSGIDVISPRRPRRKRAGIDAHTSRTLLARDIVTVDAIPCTSVARTLLDLAAVLPRRAVQRAFDEAEVLRVLDARAIDDVLARNRGHRGAGALRATLDDHVAGSTRTRNDLEEAFLAITRHAGLPVPEVNVWLAFAPAGYEADFLFREQRLIVEVDGRATHGTRRGFEHDRRRDQRLMLAGWRVVRLTWRQVLEEPAGVAAIVRGLLLAERAA